MQWFLISRIWCQQQTIRSLHCQQKTRLWTYIESQYHWCWVGGGYLTNKINSLHSISSLSHLNKLLTHRKFLLKEASSLVNAKDILAELVALVGKFFWRGVLFTTQCFIIPLKGEVIVVVVIMIGGVIDVLLMSGNLLMSGQPLMDGTNFWGGDGGALCFGLSWWLVVFQWPQIFVIWSSAWQDCSWLAAGLW